MGTTRSQSFWKFWKMFFLSLLEVAEIQTRLFGWMESVRYFFSTIPEEKWGLLVVNLFGNFGKCSSSRYWKLPKFKPDFLVEWKASDISFLSFFFNLLNRCNKATYTIPFVMNEHSVYWVIKETCMKIRQLFNFSQVVPYCLGQGEGFFFSSIHWFTHWKYVLDKIVACSLKTLMIKITVQFQKHNAMIATENFFSGGGGSLG